MGHTSSLDVSLGAAGKLGLNFNTNKLSLGVMPCSEDPDNTNTSTCVEDPQATKARRSSAKQY
jgi:hypothetical protein